MSDVGRCPKHDELLEIEMFGTTPLCRSCLREPKPGTPEGLSIKFTREFETDAASPNYQQTKATKWEVGPERAELQVSLLNALSDEIRATNKVNVLILDRVRVLTAQGSLNCERLDRMEAMFERIATEIDHVAKRYSDVASRLAQIEERLGRIDERGRYTVQQIDALRIAKPRKAGKRPVPKAKVTHKTR